MITAVIKGGLGNQLFQYASAYSLSKRLNQELALDTTFYPTQNLRGYKLDKLSIDSNSTSLASKLSLEMRLYKNRYINQIIRRSKIKKIHFLNGAVYLVENAGSFVPEFFNIKDDDIFMNGYFQSERYFKDYREEILKAYTPSYHSDAEYSEQLDKIRSCNSVAIHVRHGDFQKKDRTDYHYILNEKYYEKAIEYIKETTEAPEFFCFSDDIEWVKNTLGNAGRYHFISLHTKNADIDEMMLMKNCNHIIMANSSFSWWAGWLNTHPNAKRLVPEKKYGPKEMIPDNWIKISV